MRKKCNRERISYPVLIQIAAPCVERRVGPTPSLLCCHDHLLRALCFYTPRARFVRCFDGEIRGGRWTVIASEPSASAPYYILIRGVYGSPFRFEAWLTVFTAPQPQASYRCIQYVCPCAASQIIHL